MNDTEKLNIVLEAGAARRDDRRRFLRQASSVAVAAGATSLLAACGGGDDDASPTPTPTSSVTPTPTSTATTAIGDGDILNFALNLEYLEAQFYSFAATGAGLPATSLAAGSAATGTPGTVTGGAQVTFGDALVGQYAREIAADERAHVDFLRKTIGTTVVPMPNINIAGGATGAFTLAARAAGLVGPNDSFDPYKDDNSFLLAAYIFEDVGVTAYKGAAPLLASKTFMEAAAGLLAAEAYHAAIIRTTLSRKGLFTPSIQISDARDSLDGGIDRDQGIGTSATDANIVPTDSDGIAFSRSAGQVLNIVYLNRSVTTSGGFFPNGTNAANAFFKTSAAS
jgi:hypothetical protein